MNASLLRVLSIDNPWIDGAPLDGWLRAALPERYVDRALGLVAGERVCLVVGPRQAGKSTLVWKTLSDTGEPALYLNCEEPAIREWLRSPAEFLADLRELLPDVRALFFEEVQRLPEAGLFLKGLVDRRAGCRVYATGSSSFDLEAATRESLAGRAERHLLLPFSAAELEATLDGPPLARLRRRAAIVERLLVYGGYPAVWLAAQPERVLSGLVESFVVRDASDRFRIRHVAAFRKLLQLMAGQVGSLCNFSEWGALAGISNDTVADYATVLADTHVIRLVPPFVGGKRAELTRTPKVYFLDNGLRNTLRGGFAPFAERADRGALMEGLVFAEIQKCVNPLLDSVRYWRSRSGAEIDFVVEHRGRLLACEVKEGDPRGRVTRSARSFLAAYEPEILLVVGAAAAAPRREGRTEVRFVPPADVAAHVREFLGDAPRPR